MVIICPKLSCSFVVVVVVGCVCVCVCVCECVFYSTSFNCYIFEDNSSESQSSTTPVLARECAGGGCICVCLCAAYMCVLKLAFASHKHEHGQNEKCFLMPMQHSTAKLNSLIHMYIHCCNRKLPFTFYKLPFIISVNLIAFQDFGCTNPDLEPNLACTVRVYALFLC